MRDELTRQDLEQFGAMLRKLHEQADATRDGIEGEYLNRGESGLDTQGDAGADGEFEEVDLDALDLEEGIAEAAQAALKRIADGAYGRCTTCDGWIPRGRLQVVPYAPLCVTCQEVAEEQA
jgi:DnaK suppressor protein